MKCKNCGNEVLGNFCTKCGRKAEQEASVADAGKSGNALAVLAIVFAGAAVIMLGIFFTVLIFRPSQSAEPKEDIAAAVNEVILEDEPEDDEDYLYPTDSEYITEQELSLMSKEEVALIRNEIYARHGYTFSTPFYAEYFSGKDWYVPDPLLTDGAEAEKYFNEYERENKNTIVKYEQKMGWR